MRKIAVLGVSALVLAIGVASASAEPTTAQIMSHGQVGTVQTYAPNAWAATVQEGRAAAVEAPAFDAFIYQPHYGR
jgi:ABC-type sugar transport system substrate-binding protein